jgi:hypothetical protein
MDRVLLVMFTTSMLPKSSKKTSVKISRGLKYRLFTNKSARESEAKPTVAFTFRLPARTSSKRATSDCCEALLRAELKAS